MNKLLILLFLPLGFSACSNALDDYSLVTGETWQYDSGVRLGNGDFLEFDGEFYELRGDTIFREGSPRALIEGYDQDDLMLEVSSLPDGESGRYLNVAAFLR